MVTDVLLTARLLLVASPAAGGVVRIDRASGRTEVIPLEEDAGTLLEQGGEIWVIGSVDWLEAVNPAERGRMAVGRRTVVWEGPSDAEIAREAEFHSRFVAIPSYAESEAPWTIEQWRELEGGEEDLDPSTPIWRISETGVHRVPFDGENPIFASAGGVMVGVCRLPSDPIIKHVMPGTSLSFRYPASVVVADESGRFNAVGSVPSIGGRVCVDQGRTWLLGFGSEDDGDETPVVRELLTEERRLEEPLGLAGQNPVACVDGFVVDLMWPAPSREQGQRTAPHSQIVRFLPISGGSPLDVEVLNLSHWIETVRVLDGEVWFYDEEGSGLIAVSPSNAASRRIEVDIDCRPWMPEPEAPKGLDLQAHEREQLEFFQSALFGGWTVEESVTRPFITGVTFDSVQLREAFPDSQIVAPFHSDDRPGIQFGRRWRIYDELGNLSDLQYAEIHLLEDVESGSGGLPSMDRCQPDEAGVVWF